MSPIGEPRNAEVVHSGGASVAPGPAHSWARHPEPIRTGIEEGQSVFFRPTSSIIIDN